MSAQDADDLLPRQTSVPRWPVIAPDLDASGTSWILVGIGAPGCGVLASWQAQAAALGGECHVVELAEADAAAHASLQAVLGRTRVGARLAVTGDEADVLAVTTWARAAGVMAEELTLHAVGRAQLTVFCVHCEATHRVTGDAAVTTCPRCERTLELAEHVSGHRGSYLGVRP